jgi:hypothetical protein
VSPVKYELGFYFPEDDILHSDRREPSNPSFHRITHAERKAVAKASEAVIRLNNNELWAGRADNN